MTREFLHQNTGVNSLRVYSRIFLRFFLSFLLLGGLSCAIVATRPNQEMSNTAAALRAAREVQADTLAPEVYRQASEWFFKAKHEYKFKNFKLAREFCTRARRLAEQAEFDAIRNGGNRTDQAIPDPLDNSVVGSGTNKASSSSGSNPTPTETPYAYPTPEGTPADVYEQRKAAEDQAAKQAQLLQQQQSAGTNGSNSNGTNNNGNNSNNNNGNNNSNNNGGSNGGSGTNTTGGGTTGSTPTGGATTH